MNLRSMFIFLNFMTLLSLGSSGWCQENVEPKAHSVTQKLDMLIQRYDAAVKENKELKSKLDSAPDLAEYEKKIASLNQDLSAAKQRQATYVKEKSALNEQIAVLVQQLEQGAGEKVTATQLEEAKKPLQAQIESLKAQLQASESNLPAKISSAQALLKEEIAKLQDRLQAAEKLYAQKKGESSQSEQLRAQIAALQEELQMKGVFVKDGNAKIESLVQEKARLEKDLEKQKLAAQELQSRLEAKSKIEPVKNIPAPDAQEIKKPLQQKINALESELEQTKDSIAKKVEASQAALKAQNKDLLGQLQAAQSRLNQKSAVQEKTWEGKLQVLQNQLADAKTQIQNALESKRPLEEQVNTLKEKVADADAALDKNRLLEQRVDYLTKELAQQKQSSQNNTASAKNFEDRIAQLSTQLKQNEISIAEKISSTKTPLLDRIGVLEKQLKEKTDAAQSKESQLQSVQETQASLKAEIAKLQNKLTATEQLTVQKKTDNSQLVQLQQQIAGLQNDLKVKGAFIKDGNATIESLNQEKVR